MINNRNKLSLGFAANQSSYWIDRSAPSGKNNNYERQF